VEYPLPLGVLGGLSGPLQPVLLALFHPRVAGQQAGFLQHGTEVRVELEECARDAVRDSAGLAARTATDHLDADVELALQARDAKRRQGCHLKHAATEIGERVLVVDRDPSLAWLQAHTRDGVLAPPGPSVERFSQS
jgi:hypothetical protein